MADIGALHGNGRKASHPFLERRLTQPCRGWILPVVLFFPQALAIAELSSSMPINGAFYWWTAALAPRHLSRPFSYMLGWFSLLTTMTSLASFAFASGSSMAVLSSFLRPDWQPTNAQVMGIAMGFVILWASMQIMGIDRLHLGFLVLGPYTSHCDTERF